MSDLLDQVKAKVAAAKALRDETAETPRPSIVLPPEAQAHYDELQARHPGQVIEVERRIFLRVYDSGNDFVCVDVRNIPDQ